ncbi:hypothetical protein ACJJTC_005607 [Scirpophaga incertulas]
MKVNEDEIADLIAGKTFTLKLIDSDLIPPNSRKISSAGSSEPAGRVSRVALGPLSCGHQSRTGCGPGGDTPELSRLYGVRTRRARTPIASTHVTRRQGWHPGHLL